MKTVLEGVAAVNAMDNSNLLGEKIDKLGELGLGLGAHLINGWQGQFDRMERFYTRFSQAEDATDALDYALTFFVYAHSLREWIVKYEQINKAKFDKSWTEFVSKNPEMKVSRDICNVTKHLQLSQSASVDKHFAVFWAYDPFVTKKSEWIIYFGDRRMSLGNLMHQILTGWKQFIREELKIGAS